MQQENPIISKLKGIGTSLKQIIVPKDADNSSSKLTNKAVVNLLVNKFVQEMHDRSMENTMKFPMYFFINLSDADFLRMKDDFPDIIIELKGKLLDIIDKEKVKFKNFHHDSHWFFEFRASEHIDIPNDNEIIQVAKSHEIRKSTDTSPTDTDPNRTNNGKNNVSSEIRIMSGMQKDDRTFIPPYGQLPSYNAPSQNREPPINNENVYAVLEKNGEKFYMEQQEIHISGKNNSSKLPKTLMKLDIDLDPPKYAVIKYRPEKKQKFSIETYGALLLNDKSIELNKPYQLFSGSTITIPIPGNPVKIKFTTHKI